MHGIVLILTGEKTNPRDFSLSSISGKKKSVVPKLNWDGPMDNGANYSHQDIVGKLIIVIPGEMRFSGTGFSF